MKIGIDIDDTLTDSTTVVREYVKKYDKDYCDDQRLVNSVEKIIRGFIGDEIIDKFFSEKSIEMSSKVQIRENAKEVIDKLRSEGNQIYIITARSDNYYKNAQEFCKNYLKEHNINYDKLIVGQMYKIETCINEGIDLMIDDAVDTCEALNKKGIKSILFTSELNKDKNTDCNRVSNWLELYDYINNM